jgi:hypothetical protein
MESLWEETMVTTMVKIMDCSVSDCAYNVNKQCHTMAITVGSECPMCDTYSSGKEKGGMMDMIGGVGACRKNDCVFNKSLECSANGIHVGKHGGHADCETYKER